MSESYKEKYKKLKVDYNERKKKRDILRQLLSVAQSRCRTLNDEIGQLLDIIMESRTMSDSSDTDSTISSFSDGSDSDHSKDNTKILKELNNNIFNKKRKNNEIFLESESLKNIENDNVVPKKKRRKSSKRDSRFDAKPIKLLPRDENNNLILPVTVGKSSNEVNIISIGKVVYDREAYHSQRYIWPVGFVSKKEYISMQDPKKRTIYTNRILDGGDTPIFEVTAEDLPGESFTANSASGAWKSVLTELSKRGSTGAKTHASGPDFFGLSDLGVTKVIQELPNAEKCMRYVKQRWIKEEGNDTKAEEDNTNPEESNVNLEDDEMKNEENDTKNEEDPGDESN